MLNFQAKIKDRKLKLDNPYYFKFQISKYKDCRALVSVKIIKSKRSLSQNAWYWGVVIPLICETTGHTPNEQDRIFEQMFAPRKVVKHKNKEYVIYKHCKELTKGEFVFFVERIRAEVAEMGIVIPNPEFQ